MDEILVAKQLPYYTSAVGTKYISCLLEMLQNDETIFYYNGTYRTFRHEFIGSLGFWF